MSQFENDKKEILNSDNTNTENIEIPFWSKDPNILLNSKYISEFFPTENMTYEQQLNALTRSLFLITVLSFVITKSIRLLIVSFITFFSIFLLYYYQEKTKNKKKRINENFENPADELTKNYSSEEKDSIFDKPTSSNPFSNVLITDYEYNPEKKPAPPSFNENINDTILRDAKKLVSELNPDQPDISDKLFKDLGEQYVFEQSLRPYVSNPSTTIPNDQTGFAEFCYGSMVSCKEGNLFACARNLQRYNNY